ncbi:hypothetical protein [Jiangella muralis]|uniref:hypothetical protein n=1 Tax=Jiangella muralis TaxID=702383 RepID=UPI00069DAF3A|nr:hypothetical protein [Jiangella muralis]
MEDVLEASAAFECFTTTSLGYREDDGNETSLAETLGADEVGYSRAEALALVCRAVKAHDRRVPRALLQRI